MEEERDGVTLSRLFGTIMSQKWLVLIITVIIVLGATLGLYFGYNPQVTEYSSTFTVSFPGSEGANPKFPDNSPFNYREIISRSNIYAAQASNKEKFGYIQVGKMYEDKDISIIRTTNRVAEQEEFSYTLSVSAKYFKSRSDASDFIDALVLMPVNYLLSIAGEQAAYLLNYDSTAFFEDKIEILTNQINYLISATQDLVSNTGNSSSNIQLLSELNTFNIKLKTAIGSMRENLYVHSVEEVRATYSHQLTVIERELESKLSERQYIFGLPGENVFVQNSERIEQLATEISELEELKQIYSSYLNGKNGTTMSESAEFSAELVELGNELKALTDKYEVNLGAFYERYTLIAYDGALVKNGNLNIVVCLLIGLIAGLIISVVTAIIVGNAKQKKVSPNTEPSTDNSKQEE